ncbi:hypothetical protein Pam2_161 [Pseudanabaena phage Pam2]|nr:hypothetical protein Pam2_161 [Pseudanabaena phage Pam2]
MITTIEQVKEYITLQNHERNLPITVTTNSSGEFIELCNEHAYDSLRLPITEQDLNEKIDFLADVAIEFSQGGRYS